MSAIENNANLLLCTDYSIEAVRSIPGNMATRCEFCSKRVVISSAGRRTRDEQQAKVICSACMEDTDLIPHGTDMQFQASEAIREQVRQHTGMEIEEFGDPMEIRKRLLEQLEAADRLLARPLLSEKERERLERIAEAIDNEIGEPNGVTFLRTDPSFLRDLAAKIRRKRGEI